MKQKLLKLFALFVVMSVLTSSSKDSGLNVGTGAKAESCCPETKASSILPAVQPTAAIADDKTNARELSLADNEISLSPISRFILVQ